MNACRIQLDHQIEWTQPEQKVSKRHASNSDKNAWLASHCRERNKFLYSRPRSDILARPPCDVSNIGSEGEIRAPSRLMTTRRVQTANSRAIWRTPATSTSGLSHGQDVASPPPSPPHSRPGGYKNVGIWRARYTVERFKPSRACERERRAVYTDRAKMVGVSSSGVALVVFLSLLYIGAMAESERQRQKRSPDGYDKPSYKPSSRCNLSTLHFL